MKANAQKNTHLQAAQIQAQTKALAKSLQSQNKKNCFKKISQPFKKIKNASHNPTQIDKKSKQTMTLKPNIDNGLQGRTTEHQLPTAVLRNGG